MHTLYIFFTFVSLNICVKHDTLYKCESLCNMYIDILDNILIVLYFETISVIWVFFFIFVKKCSNLCARHFKFSLIFISLIFILLNDIVSHFHMMSSYVRNTNLVVGDFLTWEHSSCCCVCMLCVYVQIWFKCYLQICPHDFMLENKQYEIIVCEWHLSMSCIIFICVQIIILYQTCNQL